MNTKLNTKLNTPTPRTDDAQWGTGKVTTDFARTLERELTELLAVNAIGAARLAHATAQLAAEREKVRTLREACERLRDCDWVITLPDRMDAVRDIARAALDATEGKP